MKKLLQYVLLAALLIGLPVATCVLLGYDEVLKGASAFPPRTEDWGGVAYWQQRCPFSWLLFVPICLFVVVVLFPFVKRSVSVVCKGQREALQKSRFPWYGWLGLLMFLGWLPVVWTRPDWATKLQVHSFAVMGFGHALLMDALAVRRGAESVFKRCGKPLLLLLPVSALYWWFFEFLNRFSKNWFFINMEDYTTFEYVVCFSIGCMTILPSVLTTARWLETFKCFSDDVCVGMWKVDVGTRLSKVLFALVSLIGLVGVVICPRLLFPFLWFSPFCVFVLVRTWMGEGTALDSLSTGNWSTVWRWAVAMLLCGVVWETWGFWIQIRWVYSVPYLHRFCYAEMPVLGFAGYMPFGVEALLVCEWVERRFLTRG